MQPQHCANCEEPIVGAAKFCSACGQKANIHRLTLKDVLHDGFHYFTHADKGVIQLFKGLVTKPGIVAREFVMGKRKSHFPPLNFFLLSAAIYLFMTTYLKRFDQINTISNQQIEQATKDAHLSEKKQRTLNLVRERKTKALWVITHYANYVAMFAAPFLSLVVWLLYRKTGFNYTEHLTANLYLIGFTNLVVCLVLMPLTLLVNPAIRSMVFMALLFVFETGYRSVFYYRFINQPVSQDIAKTIIKSVIIVLSWFIMNFLLIAVYISMAFM